MARPTRSGRLVALALAGAGVTSPTVAQDPPRPELRNAVLAVPYVQKPELLGGGAAVEMVLRHWGETEIGAERFAGLIDVAAAGGIATDALSRSITAAGWNVVPFQGDVPEIRRQLERGSPFVALIQVETGRFHYVTVVGWVADRVVYHDPATSPYETADATEFDRAWSAADRWAIRILPVRSPQYPTPRTPEATEEPATGGPCGRDIEAARELTRANQDETAERLLLEAQRTCPGEPAVLRELAAMRIRQERYREASALAQRAWRVAADPASLRLLAQARYLEGEDVAALDAWSELGPMRMDWVNFVGVSRTNARRIVSRANLGTAESLDAERLRIARRRVAQLPTLSRARVDYVPLDSGRVEVDISVREKRPWPVSWTDGVRSAWDAAFHERLRLEAAGPFRVDDQWRLEWRWEVARRRAQLGLAVPGQLWIPGVWTVEGSRERSTFPGPLREDRRRVSLEFAAWPMSRIRVGVRAGWERFTGAGSWLAPVVHSTLALVGDHVQVHARGSAWLGFDERTDFARGDLEATWESNLDPRGLVLRARFGVSAATRGAPRSLWVGAGGGTSDVPLLRAHRLVRRGVVGGPIFGRRLLDAGAEANWWGVDVRQARLGLAAFADLGWAGARPDDALGEAFQTDIGLGVRIYVPDVGRLRIDMARGLVDGDMRLTAGLERGWVLQP